MVADERSQAARVEEAISSYLAWEVVLQGWRLVYTRDPFLEDFLLEGMPSTQPPITRSTLKIVVVSVGVIRFSALSNLLRETTALTEFACSTGW